MRSKIVENDNVAAFERRDQELLDIGEKPFAVDRAVKQAGRLDPVVAQRCEEGRGLPVTVGILSTRRWPFGAQPWRRVMLVLVHVSSMKNKRAELTCFCRSFQRRRWRLTSDRSRSRATSVFF